MKKQFSASRVAELLVDGKTRWNYIYDLALEILGIERSLHTKEMLHGINNEAAALQLAFNLIGAVANSDDFGNQIYFPINDYVGATPDAFDEDMEQFVLDTKCQYYIHTFIEQCDKVPKKYVVQSQCQMMALKVDTGYILNYLTKPEVWGEDEWEEYPFNIDERFRLHKIEKDDEIQYDILRLTEHFYPYIGLGVELMASAKELSQDEFFYSQLHGGVRYAELKEIVWATTGREVFRFGNKFYVIKK